MGPVIVNHMGKTVSAALRAHPSAPDVREPAPGTLPWVLDPDAEILVTGPDPAWRRAPEEAPEGWPGALRWVEVASAGIDCTPDWLFRVPQVTCGRGHSAVPIAEYVLAAILLHEKRLDAVTIGRASDWKHHNLGTLDGRTLGLAGFGAIGHAIAARARGFGMRLAAIRGGAWAEGEAPDVARARDLEDLAAQSDHLVLALPLLPATRNCVNAQILAAARPGLHLINIARGALIDTPALLASLDNSHTGFATLDATDPEPLPEGSALYTHPRIRLTPHISWSGTATLANLTAQVVANLTAWRDGAPMRNLVVFSRGY